MAEEVTGIPSVKDMIDMGVHPSNFLRDDEVVTQVRPDDTSLVLSKDPTEAMQNLQMNIKRVDRMVETGAGISRDTLTLPRDSWMPKWKQTKEAQLQRLEETKKKLNLSFMEKIGAPIAGAQDAITDTVASSDVVAGGLKGFTRFTDAVVNFSGTLGTMATKVLDPLVPDNRFSQGLYDVCNDAANDALSLEKALGLRAEPGGWTSALSEGILQYYTGSKILSFMGRALTALKGIAAARATSNILARSSMALDIISPKLRMALMEAGPAVALGYVIGSNPKTAAEEAQLPPFEQLAASVGPEKLKKFVEERRKVLQYQESIGDPSGRFSKQQLTDAAVMGIIGAAMDLFIAGAGKVYRGLRGTKGGRVTLGGAPEAPGGVPEGAPVGEPPVAPSGAATVTGEAPVAASGVMAAESIGKATAGQLDDIGKKLAAMEIPGLPKAPAVPKAASAEVPKGAPTGAAVEAALEAPELKSSVELVDDISAKLQKLTDAEPDPTVLGTADDATKAAAKTVSDVDTAVSEVVNLEAVNGELKARPAGRRAKKVSTTESDAIQVYAEHSQAAVAISQKYGIQSGQGIEQLYTLMDSDQALPFLKDTLRNTESLLLTAGDVLDPPGIQDYFYSVMHFENIRHIVDPTNPEKFLNPKNLTAKQFVRILQTTVDQMESGKSFRDISRVFGKAQENFYFREALAREAAEDAAELAATTFGKAPVRTALPPAVGGATLAPTKDEMGQMLNNVRDLQTVVGSWLQGKIVPNEFSFEILAKNPLAQDVFTSLETRIKSKSGLQKLQQFKDAVMGRADVVPQLGMWDKLRQLMPKTPKKKAKGKSTASIKLAWETGLGATIGTAYNISTEDTDQLFSDPVRLAKNILVATTAVYGARILVGAYGMIRYGTPEIPQSSIKDEAIKELQIWRQHMTGAMSRLKDAPDDIQTKNLRNDLAASLSIVSKSLQLIPSMDDVGAQEVLAHIRASKTPEGGVMKGITFDLHANITNAVSGVEPMFVEPAAAATLDDLIVHHAIRAQQAANEPMAVQALKQNVTRDATVLSQFTGEPVAAIEARMLADPETHAKVNGILQNMTFKYSEAQNLLKATTVDQTAVDTVMKEMGVLQNLLRGNIDGAKAVFDALPIIRNFDKDSMDFLKTVVDKATAETFGRFSSYATAVDSVSALRTLWYTSILSRPGTVARTGFANMGGAFMGENLTRLFEAAVGVPQRVWQKLTKGKVDPNLTTFGDFFASSGTVLKHLGDLGEMMGEAWRTGIKRHAATAAEASASKTSGVTADYLPRLLNADPAYPAYWALKYLGDKSTAMFRGLVAMDEAFGALSILQDATVVTRKQLRRAQIPKGVDPRTFAERMFYRVLEDPTFMVDSLKKASVTMMNNQSFSNSFVQVWYRVASHPVTTVFSQFPKVAFNTLKYIKDNIPAPAIGAIEELLSGGATSPQFQAHMGKLGYSAMAMYAGYALEQAGIIEIADEDTAGTNRALGYVTKSYIKVAGQKIPLALLGPMAPLLLIGAAGRHMLTRVYEEDDDKMTPMAAMVAALQASVEAAADNVFTDNISDLLSGSRSLADKVQLFATRFIQGFNPGIVTDVRQAWTTWARSKDAADYLFNQNPWAKTAVDLFEKAMRTGEDRRTLLNDPVLESGQILGMVPVISNEIYEEFRRIRLNDATYVKLMDEGPKDMRLPGKALEFKRQKVAEYLKDNYEVFVKDNPAYTKSNNKMRRDYMTEKVILPALSRARADAANEFPDLWDALEAERELTQAPVRDIRYQQETGEPSATPERQAIRGRMEQSMERLKLTSGGR